jgi:hypothetical protein
MAQKPMETSYDVIYKDLVKIQEVSKKVDPGAENRVL